jgi:hypothetical protein
MDGSEVPEIRIRAIAELHRIEMSLHTIFQEFPHEQSQIRPEIEREPTNCQCISLVQLHIQSAAIVNKSGVH